MAGKIKTIEEIAAGLVNTTKVASKAKKAAATLATGRAKRPAAAITQSVNLTPLRNVPVADATKIARKQPHLIPSATSAEGAYLGSPRNITNKRELAQMRKNFDKFIEQDTRGADWYDRYRNAVTEVTGGDPLATRWMTNREGQYSAGVSPEGELGFSVKDLNSQIAFGDPGKPARPAQAQATRRALAENDPDAYQLGKKTGEYARLVDPNRGGSVVPAATGVNDFRHARNFGYTDVNGQPQREGLGATQHTFLDYETALAVDRANKKGLGGSSDWTGERLQAAPWVKQKADDFFARGQAGYIKRAEEMIPKAFENRQDLVMQKAYDIALDDANRTVGDFFPKHTAYATYEAQPFAAGGHLPGSATASQAERTAYANDPLSDWALAPGGRDAIYGGLLTRQADMSPTGGGMMVRPTQAAQGVYTPPGGVMETNPAFVARPLVAFDNPVEGGARKVKTLPGADRAILDTGEGVRAFVDYQGAGAWNKPWAGGQIGQSNSAFIKSDAGPATLEQIQQMQQAGGKYNLGDVIDTGEGMVMTNFGGVSPLDKRGLLDITAKSDASGLGADVNRVSLDSGYMGYEDAWTSVPGSGAATRQLLATLDDAPQALRTSIDQNEYIPKAALNRLERDKNWQAQWGAAREDVQNARRIIGEGPGWIGRLRSGLENGMVLPVIGTAILGASLGMSDDEISRMQ